MSSDDIFRIHKKWKIFFGVCVLLVLLFIVIGWWVDFRGSVAIRDSEERDNSLPSQITTPADQADSGDAEGGGQPQTVTVLVEGLNFRTAPSSASQRIGRLSVGYELKYLGSESGWYRVRDSEGRTGYVSSKEEYTRAQ